MSRIARFPNSTPLPLSRAVLAGGCLFASGQMPVDAAGRTVQAKLARDVDVEIEVQALLPERRPAGPVSGA